MVWMVGAHDVLAGRTKWPSDFSSSARSCIHWEWSHCLRADLAKSDESGAPPMSSLLSEEARLQALQQLRTHFTEDIYLEWLSSIDSVDYLNAELAEIPATFESLYVQNR
jgi:hypothetical protein